MRSFFWVLVLNLLASPLLAGAEVLGRGRGWTTRFHDWTADRAYPRSTDVDAVKFAVLDSLREAQETAEAGGYDVLADALITLSILWAAGAEGYAKEALDGVATPFLARLSGGTPEPGRPRRALSVIVLLALVVNAAGSIVNAEPAGAYKRPRWRDDDHDCQNTRVEVLVRTCRFVSLSPTGCKVVAATCLDIYSGAEVATDTPSQSIQVDHLFPAAEAWKRRAWTPASFADFFNDQRNLIAVRSRTNLRKGDKMPDRWCPFSRGARFVVAKRFRRIARYYGLPVRPTEEAGLEAWERGECAPGAAELGGDQP